MDRIVFYVGNQRGCGGGNVVSERVPYRGDGTSNWAGVRYAGSPENHVSEELGERIPLDLSEASCLAIKNRI